MRFGLLTRVGSRNHVYLVEVRILKEQGAIFWGSFLPLKCNRLHTQQTTQQTCPQGQHGLTRRGGDKYTGTMRPFVKIL